MVLPARVLPARLLAPDGVATVPGGDGGGGGDGNGLGGGREDSSGGDSGSDSEGVIANKPARTSLHVYDMGHSRVHFALRPQGAMRLLVVRAPYPSLCGVHLTHHTLPSHSCMRAYRAQAVFVSPHIPHAVGGALATDVARRFTTKYAARIDACVTGVPTVRAAPASLRFPSRRVALPVCCIGTFLP